MDANEWSYINGRYNFGNWSVFDMDWFDRVRIYIKIFHMIIE